MLVAITTIMGTINGKINESYAPEKYIFEDPIYLTDWYIKGAKKESNFNKTTIIIPKNSVIAMEIIKG